jgi:hypothetical protein
MWLEGRGQRKVSNVHIGVRKQIDNMRVGWVSGWDPQEN